MYKILTINLFVLSIPLKSLAQVTPAFSFIQPSMTLYQPSALPNSYFDKIDGSERTDKKLLKADLYWNNSFRSTKVASNQYRQSYATTLDRLPNPTHSSVFGLKIGGGFTQAKLENIQLRDYFAHVGGVLRLNDKGLQLLGGIGMQRTQQSLNRDNILYEHPDDPDIQRVHQDRQPAVVTTKVSFALANAKRSYIGIGYRSNSGFGTPFSDFKEVNLLMQYAFGKPRTITSGWNEEQDKAVFNQARTTGTHHHLSLLICKVLNNKTLAYPTFAQLNYRMSLPAAFWIGGGLNTAKRTQLQLGYLHMPIHTDNGFKVEIYAWATYDFAIGQVIARNSQEISFGIFF